MGLKWKRILVMPQDKKSQVVVINLKVKMGSQSLGVFRCAGEQRCAASSRLAWAGVFDQTESEKTIKTNTFNNPST